MSLVIKDEEHLERVKQFCKKQQHPYTLEKLEEKLKYLSEWGNYNHSENTRCTISPDISDVSSFHVVMERKDKMNGQYHLVFVGSLYWQQPHPYFSPPSTGHQGWKMMYSYASSYA